MTPELQVVLNRSPVWQRLYDTDPRYRAAWDAGTGPGQTGPQPDIYEGPKYNHWAPLHWYAVDHAADWDGAKAKRFYRNWKKNIPNTAGCSCRAHWKKLGLTPDYFSAKAFFEWSVFAHNTVSERAEVSKPTVTFEQAYAIWWLDGNSVV